MLCFHHLALVALTFTLTDAAIKAPPGIFVNDGGDYLLDEHEEYSRCKACEKVFLYVAAEGKKNKAGKGKYSRSVRKTKKMNPEEADALRRKVKAQEILADACEDDQASAVHCGDAIELHEALLTRLAEGDDPESIPLPPEPGHGGYGAEKESDTYLERLSKRVCRKYCLGFHEMADKHSKKKLHEDLKKLNEFHYGPDWGKEEGKKEEL